MVTLPRLLEKIDRERTDLLDEETLVDVFNQPANFSLVQLPPRKEVRVVDRDTIPARHSLVSVIGQSQYDERLLALSSRFPQLLQQSSAVVEVIAGVRATDGDGVYELVISRYLVYEIQH